MNMFNSSFSESDDVIDKRIIREEYRNYDLVARYWEYGYLGKIWKNRKAVEEIDADGDEGLDDLVLKMRAQVDAMIEARCKARNNKPPSKAELLEGFTSITPKLTALEKLMLKFHAESDNAEVPMESLQRALNISNSDSIYELYARIGQKLNDEIGYQPKGTKDKPPGLKLVLGTPSDSNHLKLAESIQALILDMGW